MEQYRTVTDLTLKPLSQAALALGALGPRANRLGIIGQELDDARERPPPALNSLLAPLVTPLVLVTRRPTGLTSRDRILFRRALRNDNGLGAC
jgi:hypothetical protein